MIDFGYDFGHVLVSYVNVTIIDHFGMSDTLVGLFRFFSWRACTVLKGHVLMNFRTMLILYGVSATLKGPLFKQECPNTVTILTSKHWCVGCDRTCSIPLQVCVLHTLTVLSFGQHIMLCKEMYDADYILQLHAAFVDEYHRPHRKHALDSSFTAQLTNLNSPEYYGHIIWWRSPNLGAPKIQELYCLFR